MDQKILEQRARAFDYLFDAVVVTDMAGTIIDWNSGSESLYGYTKEEALGKPVSILHVPEDVEHITAEVLSAVAKEGRWTGEIRMLHKDGSIGWIESMVVPLFDQENHMIGALGINRDISDRVRNEEKLAYLAHHDHLTGLPNRYLLIDRLEQMIAHAGRYGQKFSVLYVDLDNFKDINDEAGHRVGDLVLKCVGSQLKQVLRNSDTIARIGGDEFVIVLSDIRDRHDAEQVAKHLLDKLHESCEIEGHAFHISGSIGVALYPDNGKSVDDLLLFSDKAMYSVKRKGKDGYQ